MLSLYFRFDALISRCSITNTDTHCSHVVTEDEASEELSAVEPECSVPIINLKSDILEAEPLSLLTEDTYVDCLLTTLPVCFLFVHNSVPLSFFISLSFILFVFCFQSHFSLNFFFLLRFYQRRRSMPLRRRQPTQQDYMVRASTKLSNCSM